MKTLSYTQSRAQYAKMLDDVVADPRRPSSHDLATIP